MSGKNAKPQIPEEPRRRRRAQNQLLDGPARFPDGSATTIADSVYQKLRRAIVRLELAPATPISENEISGEMGVSRTPVREAILRLTREKLVEVVPKSGTFVARIPLSALGEAIVVRKALEGVTVRAATAKATPSQILEFRAMIERQREISATNDAEAFHRADEDFHAAFATIGNYRGIWDLIRQVKVQVDRYRRLTLPQSGRMDMIIQEHEAVVDALAEGDADLAVQNMELHLDKLQLDIAVFRDLWPKYFIHDIEIE
ncbi:MAG: GntR family transcriptional regulator [Paracoccaceae bacterium]